MAVAVSFSLDELPASFVEDLLAEGGAATFTATDGARGHGGALPVGSLWYTYHSQHDDRVRPSHLALDGTVWRMDDPNAPIPPIDYGCRCWIEPCADPESAAAAVLPPADEEPAPLAEAFADALDEHIKPWRKLAADALEQPKAVRLVFLTEAVRGIVTTKAEAAEYARMILVAAHAL